MAKTRRRAYPDINSLTELREGGEYGARGNARGKSKKRITEEPKTWRKSNKRR